MATNHDSTGLIILSLFCAGGLYAYVREALRLRRLMASGTVALATVLKKEKIDRGSESVVHFIVTYEFVDDQGRTIVHGQDLNPFGPIPRGLPRLLSLRRWSPEKNTGFRVKPGMTSER
jgi:hypothetical protein